MLHVLRRLRSTSSGQDMQDKLRVWWEYEWKWLKQYKRWVLMVLVAVVFVCVAILVTFLQQKTFWDWLQLLVVPAALAGAGLWFSRQQTSRQSELAEDKRREDLLAACLDVISDLLLKGELRQNLLLKGELRQMPVGRAQGQGPTIARARTLVTLRGLDPARTGELVRFLYEASLIISETPIIDLSGANLNGAYQAGTTYNKREFIGMPATQWPKDFAPDKAGAMAIEDAVD